MGRKQTEKGTKVPPPSSAHNRDLMQRVNFLYQTSIYLANIAPTQLSLGSSSTEAKLTAHSDKQTEQSNKEGKRDAETGALDNAREGLVSLAQHHASSIRVICNKAVMRMDPSIKRTICRGCQNILIPGATSTVRIKKSSSHGNAVQIRCRNCTKTRLIPAPPTENSAPSSSSSLEPTSTAGQGQAEAADSLLTDETITSGTPTESNSENLEMRRSTRKPRKPKKPKPKVRKVPFFERSEHVIYRGEQLLEQRKSQPDTN
ncbi:hypothetical protein FRC02_009400 [Tulasnella sp. 418]|nr:hypothetical protein FRC02_009400 [Tulasnella sp. 418]